MGKRDTRQSNFAPALEAIANLGQRDLYDMFSGWQVAAMMAHHQIQIVPIDRKTSTFYRHFLPLRTNLIALLADIYRRYFKLALANPHNARGDPDGWARVQLRPAFGASLESIGDWYALACDGAQPIGTVEYRPGETVSVPIALAGTSSSPEFWRAPAWLFQVSIALVGIGLLKEKHVPETDSEQKLSAAHTRLLLKGARKVFLWALEASIERARNEETAAAGTIPPPVMGGETRGPNNRKGWEQREKLYRAIRAVLKHDPSLQAMKFCAELDKRHAPPLDDWKKLGQWPDWLTWKQAWGDRDLRRKIRRVRQEAMKKR